MQTASDIKYFFKWPAHESPLALTTIESIISNFKLHKGKQRITFLSFRDNLS